MKLQKLLLVALAGVIDAGLERGRPGPEAGRSRSGRRRRRLPSRASSAPVRGVAQLGYTKPVVKRGTIGGKPFVITTIQVKNMATGAIAGLKVDEFWYDKAGNPVTGDNYRHPRPLQPGEVITITLETPSNPAMNRNQYNFSHANGEIKATLQPKL